MAQISLAALAGMTQSHLAQAERGHRGLSIGNYARLAKALRVRIEDLLPIEDGASGQ